MRGGIPLRARRHSSRMLKNSFDRQCDPAFSGGSNLIHHKISHDEIAASLSLLAMTARGEFFRQLLEMEVPAGGYEEDHGLPAGIPDTPIPKPARNSEFHKGLTDELPYREDPRSLASCPQSYAGPVPGRVQGGHPGSFRISRSSPGMTGDGAAMLLLS